MRSEGKRRRRLQHVIIQTNVRMTLCGHRQRFAPIMECDPPCVPPAQHVILLPSACLYMPSVACVAFRQQVSTLSVLEEERSRIVHCPRYPPCHDTFNHVSNRGPIATFFQVPCPAASHSSVPLPTPAPVESYQIRRIEVAGRWSCPIHAPNSPRSNIQLWPQPWQSSPARHVFTRHVTSARSQRHALAYERLFPRTSTANVAPVC